MAQPRRGRKPGVKPKATPAAEVVTPPDGDPIDDVIAKLEAELAESKARVAELEAGRKTKAAPEPPQRMAKVIHDRMSVTVQDVTRDGDKVYRTNRVVEAGNVAEVPYDQLPALRKLGFKVVK